MQQVIRIPILPENALDAACAFHSDWLRQVKDTLDQGEEALALILPQAPYDHADWRRAVVRDLARQYAPQRVNLVVGDDEMAIEAMLAYLEHAPGVTGQLLPVAGEGGGASAD